MINETQISQEKPKKQFEESLITQLIVFNLGTQEFGVDIQQVREVIRVGAITPVPDSPDIIRGMTNVRGEIVLVMDPKKRFHIDSQSAFEARHIIITEQEKNLFGLLVDEVTEVLRIPESEIKPTPKLVLKIDRIYIHGVITLGNRLITVLDLTKVLSEKELIKLAEIFKAAQERKEEHEPKGFSETETETVETVAKQEEAVLVPPKKIKSGKKTVQNAIQPEINQKPVKNRENTRSGG